MTSTLRKSIVALLLLLPCPVLADVSLPAIFSDNMVLQRQIAISVWGNASANEEITIELLMLRMRCLIQYIQRM